MVSLRATVISVAALAASIQYCPAPPLAPLAAVVAGGVATAARVAAPVISRGIGAVRGTVKGARAAEKLTEGEGEQDDQDTENAKRSMQDMHVIRTFNRVNYIAARQDPNQRAWQLCGEQLGNATVTFSGPAEGEVLAEGIPPACMTLSGVLTGKYNEGNPVPMGVDSILFTGLTDETIDEIEDALSAKQAKV